MCLYVIRTIGADAKKMRLVLLGLILLAISGNGIAGVIKITQPVRFLALGDSYTIGQSVTASESWPLQFTKALADEGITAGATKVIAQTGWRTEKRIEPARTGGIRRASSEWENVWTVGRGDHEKS